MKSLLEVKGLSVMRGSRQVLGILHLVISEGEILAVIGPNGAGKSTLMLAIAQLIKLNRGEIYYRGRLIRPRDGLDFRRQIALVLQDPLLLDASVFENIATGLRFRRIPKAEITSLVDQWLERLEITHLKDRVSHQLSGGEAQRVSLARALALKPDILMLDEPFGALDAPTRSRLLDDFYALISETATTTIFVTHDQDEALLMGDRVAVIIDGQLHQIASPEDVFNAPADSDVAAFVGVDTVIPGRVTGFEEGCVIVEAKGLQLEAVGDLEPGREVFFCLRPEDITLWIGDQLPASSARNRLAGNITRIKRQGALVRVEVRCCEMDEDRGFSLVALVTYSSAVEMSLEPGVRVTLTF
ncbi:ABC transporter ATP-binding protein, partial [Chloroflexota bacterium]